MRISEFIIQKLKSFFNPQSAICIPHSLKYFSLNQQWVLFFIALLILGILYFKFYYHPIPYPSEEFVQEIVVEVSGEVRNPGIYIFQNPPTLKEAIEKAGGLKEPAKFDSPSSQEVLETGTLLTVMKESSTITPSSPHPAPLPPREREEGKGPLLKGGHGGIKQGEIKIRIGRMAANKLLIFSIPLDLNRVSLEDLCLIPGMGKSLAQEIIAYRERRRGFRSIEELKNVKGIGEKKWKDLKKFFLVHP
jgi:competence protein ComEA